MVIQVVKHVDGSYMQSMRANKMETSPGERLPVAVPKLALPSVKRSQTMMRLFNKHADCDSS